MGIHLTRELELHFFSEMNNGLNLLLTGLEHKAANSENFAFLLAFLPDLNRKFHEMDLVIYSVWLSERICVCFDRKDNSSRILFYPCCSDWPKPLTKEKSLILSQKI